jgi:hypothetical protein
MNLKVMVELKATDTFMHGWPVIPHTTFEYGPIKLSHSNTARDLRSLHAEVTSYHPPLIGENHPRRRCG